MAKCEQNMDCFKKWKPNIDNDSCRISIGKLISKEQ